MSGIDRITKKIQEQAKLQAKNRVNYAEETVEKNEAGLSRRFERTMEAEKKRAVEEGSEAGKRVIANVKLEGRKKKLSARQDAVNMVFDKAVEKMAGLPEDEYISFMSGLAESVLSKGDNKLILSKKDKAAISDRLVKSILKKAPDMKVSVSDETVSSAGGLIVRNGDIQTNLTLESIIRLEREKLEADVVGLIFESE